MTLDDLILGAEPYRPKYGGRLTDEGMASLSAGSLCFAAKLLDGNGYVRVLWNDSAQLLFLRPVPAQADGALKVVLTKRGSAVVSIGSVRRRIEGIPKGRLPITSHRGVLVIGTVPSDAGQGLTIELRGTTAAEVVQYLYNAGVTVSETVARAIAAKTGLSVTAVRDLADKAAAAGRQNGLAGLNAEGRTAAQIARAEARANGAAE